MTIDPDPIGSLRYLPLNELEVLEESTAPEFAIVATARLWRQCGVSNCLPVVVRASAQVRYQVIGNAFVYAVAQKAGLERVWCIIVQIADHEVPLVRALAREAEPKLNLATATREEIAAALRHVALQPDSPLKSINVTNAVHRIDSAPRHAWRDHTPIADLKCGITPGKKLDALEQVFYVTPEEIPQEEKTDTRKIPIPELMTLGELKLLAKSLGIAGYSKLRRDELLLKISRKGWTIPPEPVD